MGWFKRRSKATENDAETQVETEEVTADVPTDGPYDQADHPERGDLIDVGALWLPQVPDAQLVVAANANKTVVAAIGYARENSAIQFEVFAAPRVAGVWDDVRRDMITDIATGGGSSTEVEGPFGTEVRGQLLDPTSGQLVPRRIIGIDGPRWFLSITLLGIAAVDESQADKLLEIVKDVVVVRGEEPHPPRERLALHIPQLENPAEA